MALMNAPVKQIAVENAFYTKVLPTFRADELFFINKDKFNNYILKLAKSVDFEINTFYDFLKAIDQRIKFFHKQGCRLSDFGVGEALNIIDFKEEDITKIFANKLIGKALTTNEINKYRSFLFIYLGKKYHEYNWVQQYHLGPIRNNNSRLVEQVGVDAGVDSIGDFPMAQVGGS